VTINYKSNYENNRTTLPIAGFTLIELMVVVAIVAIIAAIAYPSYLDQVRKSRRSDAYNALLDASNSQVQFFLDNKSYTSDMTKLGFAADPGISADGYYQVDIAVAGDLTTSPPYFKLTATPRGPQTSDTKCAVLTLDSRNMKEAKNSGGVINTEECWNN
jgi:type IV pilus assembly protein PilE